MKETDWHHAPLHRFVPGAVTIVTGATLYKQHFFKDDVRLKWMQSILFAHLGGHGWRPHAWACFSNHYHFIASVPEKGVDMTKFMRGLHGKLAIGLNRVDGVEGRKVMYQFWDKCITFDNSYYARLNYVMNNPVKHGLVTDARTYPWCSAHWFERNNSSAFRRRVASYAYDKIDEPDDF